MQFGGIRLWATVAVLAIVPYLANAQILQSGNVTPGHALAVVTNNVVKDAGTSSNPSLSSVALYGNGGCPFSLTSTSQAGTPTGQYVQTCLSATNSGVTLSVVPAGGLGTVPFTFDINGTAYTIGGTNWLSSILDSQFSSTPGSIIYRGASNWSALAPGLSGEALQSTGTSSPYVQWAATAGVGTVTSVATGNGLTGGPITSSGTIGISAPVSVANGGTGQTSLTAHGVLIAQGSSAVASATPGVAGTVLESNGTGADPTWQSVSGTGTVTSVSTSTGLTGGPITTTGTLSVASNGITNALLAQGAANTLKGNPTGSSANETDVSVPSCSTSNDALTWTSASGFGCNSFPNTVPTVTTYNSGSGTYTTPTGALWLQVTMCGGGGGSGGVATQSTGHAGAAEGGAAGGCLTKVIASPSASYGYVVGAGGTGGLAGNNNGTAGGNSTFGTAYLVADGGALGDGSAGGTTFPIFSTAQSAGGTASGGDINQPGGFGRAGMTLSSAQALGGAGGENMLAASTPGGLGTTAGTAPAACGGGASGAAVIASGSATAGANGAPGCIQIIEHYGY